MGGALHRVASDQSPHVSDELREGDQVATDLHRSLPSPQMPDDHEHEPTPPTQLTQPKGIDPKTGKPYEPIEIPIPNKDDFEQLVRRVAKGPQRTTRRAVMTPLDIRFV